MIIHSVCASVGILHACMPGTQELQRDRDRSERQINELKTAKEDLYSKLIAYRGEQNDVFEVKLAVYNR